MLKLLTTIMFLSAFIMINNVHSRQNEDTICSLLLWTNPRATGADIERLHQQGVNMNQLCDSAANTPLHLAVRAVDKGHRVEIVDNLLRAGASPRVFNDFDQLPLDLAEERIDQDEQHLWAVQDAFKKASDTWINNRDTFATYEQAQEDFVQAQKMVDSAFAVRDLILEAMQSSIQTTQTTSNEREEIIQTTQTVNNEREEAQQELCRLVLWWEVKVTVFDIRNFHQQNVDMNQSCNIYQDTPLHIIITKGDNGQKDAIIRELLIAGADVLATNNRQRRPVDIAEEYVERLREELTSIESQLPQQRENSSLLQLYNELLDQRDRAIRMHQNLIDETNKQLAQRQ